MGLYKTNLDTIFLDDEEMVEKGINYSKQDILSVINDHEAWLYKSIDLKKTADKILESIREEQEKALQIMKQNPGKVIVYKTPYQIYYLLIGFSIENLLKGIFVLSEHFSLNEKGKIYASTKIDHNLLRFAKTMKINLDELESQLLDKLTRYIIWEGRYPTPIWVNQFNFSYETSFDEDVDLIEDLYIKLSLVIEEGSNIT